MRGLASDGGGAGASAKNSRYQDLHKQLLDLRQKGLPKVRHGIVVGMQTTGDVAKGNGFVGCLFQIPRTEETGGITMEQDTQQNLWSNRHTAHGSIVGGRSRSSLVVQ